jgi:NADPH2:quinone reductase
LHAVLCNGFDLIKALTVGEAPELRPAPDEVLVNVHAASVSHMDTAAITRCGRPYPTCQEQTPDRDR